MDLLEVIICVLTLLIVILSYIILTVFVFK